jgi:hypothetical protein
MTSLAALAQLRAHVLVDRRLGIDETLEIVRIVHLVRRP